MRKERRSVATVRFVGLDVHAATIAVAIAERHGEVRSLGVIPHTPEAVRRLVRQVGPPETLRCCHEAGPTGYGLYWQLTGLGASLRRGGPHAGAGEGGRPHQDRPP